MTPLAIRPMGPADLDLALDWAAAEGWNPGLADAGPFTTVDPDGLLVGEVSGEPVGCITVVNYDAAFAFLGFYIVRPEWRGRGLGLALWQAGLAHAGDRLVGLDGVVAQQANYARSGFALAHRNLRYSGDLKRPQKIPDHLRPLTVADLDAVVRLDGLVFPANRRGFWEAWLTAPGHIALGVENGDGLGGFGVLRPCREGAKIGPLVAGTRAQAERLLEGLVAAWGGGRVFMDVPEPNANAVALAEAYGMKPMFETARMYTGRAPKLQLNRTFGITTFELG